MVFPKLIYTFLVAMIPAVEVKGAIPFGMALPSLRHGRPI